MHTKHLTSRAYIVGLTGGIGSGKSTVSDLFEDLGIKVVDADVISKQLVQSNSPALNKIKNHFDSNIIQADGELNRALLREIIFNNPEEKKWLEDLLHPLIRTEITQQIHSATSPYTVLSAPLLLESKQYGFVSRVLVIDTPTELQIERTIQRDSTTAVALKKIISAQMPAKDRLAQADDVIINDRDIAYLKQQVLQLHKLYSQQVKE